LTLVAVVSRKCQRMKKLGEWELYVTKVDARIVEVRKR
jgi:hypothetical protein